MNSKHFTLLLLLGLSVCTPSGTVPQVGERLADFRLDSLQHERFYLNRQQGRVTVLLFWATWCSACKSEMAALKGPASSSVWRDVTVAAVCTDPENLEAVKAVSATLELPFQILLDRRGALFKRFNLTALPITMVLDRDLRLRFFRYGFDANVTEQINQKIIRLLGDGDHQ